MYLWEEKLLSILGSACIQLWALINGLFKAAIGMPLRQGIGMDISHWTFIIIDCFILCADLVRILKRKQIFWWTFAILLTLKTYLDRLCITTTWQWQWKKQMPRFACSLISFQSWPTLFFLDNKHLNKPWKKGKYKESWKVAIWRIHSMRNKLNLDSLLLSGI